MGPITDAHKLTYQRNVELAVQQRKSRFEPGFMYASNLKGRLANMLELIGSTTAIVDGARGGDTPNIDNQVEPVWVVPHQIEWGKLIEKEDAIKALTDYDSPFCQAGAAAIVRGRDVIFAAALLGNRLIGQDGTTSSAFVTTNRDIADTVGSSDGATASGMLVKKIQRGKRLFRAQYVELDYEDVWCAVNAQGMEELYNDILTLNTDYAKMAVLDTDNKVVNRVASTNIVSYEGLADVGGDYGFAMWCKSGMYYGDFDPLQTSAEPNPAKKYRLHPYMENWFGASRSEDAKVVRGANKK